MHHFHLFNIFELHAVQKWKIRHPRCLKSLGIKISGKMWFFTMVSSLQYHHLPLLPHCLATLSSALNKQQQNYNCVAQFFFANNYFLIENHSLRQFFLKLLKLIIYNLRQLFSGSDLGSAIWTSPILYCKVKVNTK